MTNHPVYDKMKAEAARIGRTPYLDTADVAKCLRTTLKAKFPATRFSITIKRYSGGSSADVSWLDGPTDALVSPICDAFEGKGFDGMIDMAYSKHVFLMPDGSAAFAGTSGTEGSMGTVPAAAAWKPHPDAIRVSPGCYVFTHRSLSLAAVERALKSYATRFADAVAEAIEDGRIKAVTHGNGCAAWVVCEGPEPMDGAGTWATNVLHRYAARRMVAA